MRGYETESHVMLVEIVDLEIGDRHFGGGGVCRGLVPRPQLMLMGRIQKGLYLIFVIDLDEEEIEASRSMTRPEFV